MVSLLFREAVDRLQPVPEFGFAADGVTGFKPMTYPKFNTYGFFELPI
jgi:hypothetical protein